MESARLSVVDGVLYHVNHTNHALICLLFSVIVCKLRNNASFLVNDNRDNRDNRGDSQAITLSLLFFLRMHAAVRLAAATCLST